MRLQRRVQKSKRRFRYSPAESTCSDRRCVRPRLFALWYGCLTFIVVHTLHYLLFHNGDTDAGYQLAMQTHQRVVTLNDFAPVQYRFFSYYVPELIHRLLGTNIPQSYTAFRWVWLWGSCLALQRYLCSWFDWRTAFIGNLIVIATMPFMYLEVDLLNTDAPACAFFVLGLMLLREERSIWLLATVPLSMLFRETGVLVLFAWLAVTPAMKHPRMEITKLLVAAALAMSVYLGIRLVIGPKYNPWAWPLIWQNLTWPAAYFKLFATFNVLWLLTAPNLRRAPPFMRHTFFAAPVVILVLWMFGIGTAARYYFPLFPLLLPLGLLSLNPAPRTSEK